MSLKNFFKIASLTILIGMAAPVKSIAADITPVSENAADTRLLNTITNRVAEIQSMDKTNLSTAEKRELKKELKEMKHQADGLGKGVYLSVGAIIIIILLLILIL